MACSKCQERAEKLKEAMRKLAEKILNGKRVERGGGASQKT